MRCCLNFYKILKRHKKHLKNKKIYVPTKKNEIIRVKMADINFRRKIKNKANIIKNNSRNFLTVDNNITHKKESFEKEKQNYINLINSQNKIRKLKKKIEGCISKLLRDDPNLIFPIEESKEDIVELEVALNVNRNSP